MIDDFGIIGSGNTAWQLSHHFTKAKCKLAYISSRNLDEGPKLAKGLGIPFFKTDEVPTSKGQFICVNDDSISKVSEALMNKTSWQVHCSGSVSINMLNHKVRGVFYPLQTMTKGRLLDSNSIPVCLETNDAKLQQALEILANCCTFKWYGISSKQREQIHVSAVMVNNFVNHILHKANDLAMNNGLDTQMFLPLANETIKKAFEIGGRDSQTGPAKRGDKKVISAHLEQLEDEANSALYEFISQSIEKEFEKR